MSTDFEGKTITASAVPSATYTTADDTDGTTVDLLGYGGVEFISLVGVEGDTLSGSVKIEMQCEYSDDDSTWVDCTDAMLDTSVTATATGTFGLADADAEIPAVFKTNIRAEKLGHRYVRAVLLMTGTHSTGTPVGIISIKHSPKYGPAA